MKNCFKDWSQSTVLVEYADSSRDSHSAGFKECKSKNFSPTNKLNQPLKEQRDSENCVHVGGVTMYMWVG